MNCADRAGRFYAAQGDLRWAVEAVIIGPDVVKIAASTSSTAGERKERMHQPVLWASSGLLLLLGCVQPPIAHSSEQLAAPDSGETGSRALGTLLSPYTTSPSSPARHAPSALERSVLAEVNRLRDNPAAYVDTLRLWQGAYRDNILLVPGQDKAIHTTEGEAALTEALGVLARTGPLSHLRSMEALAWAAEDHVLAQGATRTIGHRGADGSNSLQRISRHGRSRGRSAEVIDYGWDQAQDIVVDLLIDDGIADRGHRRALLDPVYVVAGVACGPHLRYGVMCVVEMAERFDLPSVTIASVE